MALMKYRSKNKATDIGIKPAHDWTQIVKYGVANNNTVIIHTVTAGKTFFLKGFSGSFTQSGAGGTAALIWRDAADALVVYFFAAVYGSAGNSYAARDYSQPIEIPSGHDICAYSDTPNCRASVCIDGGEE